MHLNILVVISFFLQLAMNFKTVIVKGNLKITPYSGPVTVLFDQEERQFSLNCTCNVTTCGGNNITWELPTLNFAELLRDHLHDDNLNITDRMTIESGKLVVLNNDDLWERSHQAFITVNQNGSILYTSILTVRDPIEWDEGYYICRSGNDSAQIYLFPPKMRSANVTSGKKENTSIFDKFLPNTNLTPLKMKYNMGTSQSSSLIIPCTWSFPPEALSPILEVKSADGRWMSVVNHTNNNRNHKIRAWKSDGKRTKYHGLELILDVESSNKESGSYFGLYRCASRMACRSDDTIEEIDISIVTPHLFGWPFIISTEESFIENNIPSNIPVIRPAVEFLVFQTGFTFSLVCDIGIGWNITWKISSASSSSVGKTRKRRRKHFSTTSIEWTTSKSDAVDDDRITATLTVEAASYLDMGYYTCHRSDDESIATKQFVFIRDWKTFLLPPFSNSSSEDVIFQSSAVIGCVPTDPTADVMLYRKNKTNQFFEVIYSSLMVAENNNSSNINEGSSALGMWEYDFFQGFKINNITWEFDGEYQCTAQIKTPTFYSGRYFKSRNITKTHSFNISHVKGIELMTPHPSSVIVEGDNFELSCRWMIYNDNDASKSNSSDVTWHLIFPNNTHFKIDVISAHDSNIMTSGITAVPTSYNNGFRVNSLLWENIPITATGSSFNCVLDNTYSSSSFDLKVLEERLPRIISTVPDNVNEAFHYVNSEALVLLTCRVDALPLITQQSWSEETMGVGPVLKNNSLLPVFYTNYSKDASTLSFRADRNFTGGDFTCSFSNSRNKTASHTFKVRVNSSSSTVGYIVGVTFAVVVILILTCLLGRTIQFNLKRRKLEREKRERILRGDPGRINPEGPLEEQLNLLPYDPKWEFPRNRLILGIQLGSGEFGTVVKGTAVGTVDNLNSRKETTVAVKTVKSSFDQSALQSLASELKILIHIGPHLNIVNLFGACTKNIIKSGELLVIEEFCRYGNLRDYLIKNRQHYVNELDPCGDLLLIPLEEGNELLSNRIKENYSIIYNMLGCQDLSSNHLTTNYQDEEEDVEDIDGYLTHEHLEMVKQESNNKLVLSTRNLICWSFQISQGMCHLANKKVIHADLAARNILLTEGNVAKIADFGLSRQLSKYSTDGNYLKKGEEALPVKWMAIESLTDRIFSTQSDVWSFGILLWEIFSLGRTPYADIANFTNLVSFLEEGQRLQKPVLIPNFVADLMASCWEKEPGDRPTFNRLEQDLGNIFEESVQHLCFKMIDDSCAENAD